MEFRFASSPPDLAPLVAGFAERRDSKPLGVALELPQQRPLLQFILRGDYSMSRTELQFRTPPVPCAALWGATRATYFGHHESPLHVFVVILTNLAVGMLAGARPSEIAEKRIGLCDVWPTESSLTSKLVEARSFSARVNIAENWLRRLHQHALSDQTLLVADRIAAGALRGSVNSIARQCGQDLRSLRRRFHATLGRGPKECLRLARLQRALWQLHPQPWCGETREDALLEYFDDAHFAKDFRGFATISPRQYRLSKLRIGDPLINTVYGIS